MRTQPSRRDAADDVAGALDAIRQALDLLLEPGTVTELRVLNTDRGTVSGYYDAAGRAALVRDAAAWSGRAPGVYVLPGPVQPDLLARAVNHVRHFVKEGDATQDTHILRRRWLYIDVDPDRPSGISSTDAQHEAALARARAVRDWLIGLGFPADSIILADSGNGGHVLVRLDLPNDGASKALVDGCLAALAFQFEHDGLLIDRKVGNAARIWKLYGTVAAKGDSTPERPHRLASILEAPERPIPAPREVLERLAAMAPPKAPESTQRAGAAGQRGEFDLARWIAENNLPVVLHGPWQGGERWVLNPCPWDAAHANRAAYIVQFPSRAIAAGCHHNGCAGRDWHALRDQVEPGWRERATPRHHHQDGGEGERAGADDGPDGVALIAAAGFQPEPVRWAWRDRIPLGMVTLLVGIPGQGKSTLTVELLARASRGCLPGDLKAAATVAIATAEDAIAQVVVPRLIAAGADLDRVRLIQVKREGIVGGLSLPDDIAALRDQLLAAEAHIVVVDPLVAHIGGSINTWKDADVRRVLAPLAHLAEDADAAVIGVMHLNKSQTSDVLNKVGGSVGFGAAARSVLFFAPDPDEPEGYERILAHAKSNVGPLAPALRFRVEGREIGGEVGEPIKTSGVVWCGEAEGVSAADLVREAGTTEDRKAKTAKEQAVGEAKDVIRQLLTNGPRDSESMQAELKRLSIKERDWRRAKADLGVRSEKASFAGGWVWVLPEGGRPALYNAQSSIFGEERESHAAKYLKNAEGGEGDEDGRESEGGQARSAGVDEFHLTKASKADEGGEDGHIEGNRPLRGPEVVIEPPRTREPGEDDVEDGEEEVEWTG